MESKATAKGPTAVNGKSISVKLEEGLLVRERTMDGKENIKNVRMESMISSNIASKIHTIGF